LLTKYPGSSVFYTGSIVSYSNDIKQEILQVPSEVIAQKGAVSEAIVIEMAKQCLKLMKTDYSIAVSGIMGPDGGTEDKPVGTVWIAVADKKQVKTQRLQLRYDRERNITLAAMNALNSLRMLIVDNP
jgi:nicotinamide-nucleotide amidase